MIGKVRLYRCGGYDPDVGLASAQGGSVNEAEKKMDEEKGPPLEDCLADPGTAGQMARAELFAAAAIEKSAHPEEKDIHRTAAAMMHGVSEDQVTPEMRREAKELSFWFLYEKRREGNADAGVGADDPAIGDSHGRGPREH